MRRILVTAVIGIMFIFVIGSSLILAETESGNFEKVSQEILVNAEAKLKAIAQEIDDCLRKIPEDGVADYQELLDLKKKIDEFDAVKSDADKSLEIYALAVNTTLNPILRKAVCIQEGYFSHSLWNRDKGDKLKRFFVRLSGKNLLVKDFPHFMPLKICLGVLVGSLIICALSINEMLTVISVAFLFLSLMVLIIMVVCLI